MSPIKLDPDHATAVAFDDPRPGDRFHEMFSWWVIVVEVEDGRVSALEGPGPLNWERGRLQGGGELVEPFQERAQVREFASVEAFKAAYAYGTIPGYSVVLADRGNDVTIAREHIRAARAAAPEAEMPAEHPSAQTSVAQELRAAAEAVRCDHEYPIAAPHTPATPGPCRKCGKPCNTRTTVGRALREPLAALLDGIADMEPRWPAGFVPEEALAIARAINGSQP